MASGRARSSQAGTSTPGTTAAPHNGWPFCPFIDAPRQIRQAVAEYAILPLGCAALHQRLPHVPTLLLFGAERTGKTMLAQVGQGKGGG